MSVFIRLSVFISLFVFYGCDVVKNGSESEINEARTGQNKNEIIEILKSRKPETATSFEVIDAGQEMQIQDTQQQLSISIPANSFTQVVAAAVEPVTEVAPEELTAVLTEALSFEGLTLTAKTYKNPVLVNGFRLTVKNIEEQPVDSGLDFQICRVLETYNPALEYITVITDSAGQRQKAHNSLAEGSTNSLCFATTKGNAVFLLVSLEVEESAPADTTPPTGVAYDFSVLATDQFTANAEISLSVIDDATQIAITQGTLCSETATWADLTAVLPVSVSQPIILDGNIEENISLSIRVRDAAQNQSECLTQTISFTNSIAQNLANNQNQGPVLIDTRPPSAPPADSIINPEYSVNENFTVSWTQSSDKDVASYNLKMCPVAQTCRQCTSDVQKIASSSSPSGQTAGALANVDLYACVQAEDQAGNLSDWARSSNTTIYLDNGVSPYIKRLGSVSGKNFNVDGFDTGFSVVYDQDNRHMYIVGTTNTYFPDKSVTLADSDNQDIFALKVTHTGEILWVQQLTNPETISNEGSYERPMVALLDSNGNLVVAGQTTGSLSTKTEIDEESNEVIVGVNKQGFDPFIVRFDKENGTITKKKQIVDTVDSIKSEYSGDLIADGKGGFYYAMVGEKEYTVGEGESEYSAYQHFFAIYQLDHDLEFTADPQITPFIESGKTFGDRETMSLHLDSQQNIIVGMTTEQDKVLEYCSTHKDKYFRSECEGAGGTWFTSSYQSGGHQDALVVKFSGAEATKGKVLDHYQFGANFSASSNKRNADGFDSILELIVHPKSDVIYIQGATGSDFAETNGHRAFSDPLPDIFVASLSSDLEFSWVTHFGEETIGFGSYYFNPEEGFATSNFDGNVSQEISTGALFRTVKGELFTSFSSMSDFLQELDPGPAISSIFISLNEDDGSILWKKQYAQTNSGLSVNQVVGDIHGNNFFTGMANGAIVEAGTEANNAQSDTTDIVFGVVGPEGDLTLP